MPHGLVADFDGAPLSGRVDQTQRIVDPEIQHSQSEIDRVARDQNLCVVAMEHKVEMVVGILGGQSEHAVTLHTKWSRHWRPRQDLNPRPTASKATALSGLRYGAKKKARRGPGPAKETLVYALAP